VTSTKSEAAAAVSIGAGLALRKRAELLDLLRPCFARPQPWLQAGKYTAAVMSELPERNGWSIARHAGDRTPDKTQRLLNHAVWDTFAAMRAVGRFAVAGLEQAARRGGRRRGLVIGAIDETGQEKAGDATAGVKRQYLGCAGRVANGINTVHLSYVREGTGHALIGARQWIPREQIEDPARSLLMGLPLDLEFRTKGQLAIALAAAAAGDGIRPDFYCGDEVYGNCTRLRGHFEAAGQAYVLRVPSNFMLTLAAGTKLTCKDTVTSLLKHKRRWEIRSAGKGPKGDRWYAWAWLATASPRHHLLIRRHLKTGELAFCYCYVPEGQLLSKTRLIRAAGLRWPVEIRHLRYRSTRVVLSLPCSLSVGGLGPAGAAVEPCRAGPSLAELLHLCGVCGDDPVLAAGGVPGGDPAAVDPVVDAGGGHAQGGGQAGDRPAAGCQAR
jgi:DDE superfamily endonuclease